MVQFQVYIFLATAEGDPMTIHRGEAVLTTGNRVRLQQRHPRQPMQLLLHGPPVPVSYQPREEIDGPMSTADFNSNIIQMLILRRDEPARASPPLPLLRAQPSRSSACSTRRRHGSQTSLFCDWRSLNKKPGLLLREAEARGLITNAHRLKRRLDCVACRARGRMQRERETKAKTGLSPIKFHNALVATERRVPGRPENPLLELLLHAELVGVATLLLAAVHGARVEASVAPVG